MPRTAKKQTKEKEMSARGRKGSKSSTAKRSAPSHSPSSRKRESKEEE